jgi:hypothetical protein
VGSILLLSSACIVSGDCWRTRLDESGSALCVCVRAREWVYGWVGVGVGPSSICSWCCAVRANGAQVCCSACGNRESDTGTGVQAIQQRLQRDCEHFHDQTDLSNYQAAQVGIRFCYSSSATQ